MMMMPHKDGHYPRRCSQLYTN